MAVKRDTDAIANIIALAGLIDYSAEDGEPAAGWALEKVATGLADYFRETVPDFDSEAFIDACEVL